MYAAKYVLTAKGNGKNLMTDESERRRQEGSNPPHLRNPVFLFQFFAFLFFQTLCVTFLFFTFGLLIFQSTHKGKILTKLGSSEAEA